MSAPLAFAFNQLEMEKIANDPNTVKVIFSVQHVLHPPAPLPPGSFVFVQGIDANGNPSSTNPTIIDGCPYPPGWDPIGPAPIGGMGPLQFIIDKNPLGTLLAGNLFEVGTTRQVLAQLEGRSPNPGRMQMVLSLKSLDKNGNPNGNPDADAGIN